MNLTIEQLKFAREIGATHIDTTESPGPHAFKYSWRAGKKADAGQDLKKAAWYLNRAADELETNK